MKSVQTRRVLLCAYLILFAQLLPAQQKTDMVLRITEMNDFLNITGNGTDRAFTNGTRIDLFYRNGARRKKSIFDRVTLSAGSNSVDVHGWSLMQVMVTPNDIARTGYQSKDYAYAGGLFVSHSRYSYDPKKRLTVETDLVLGIRGPASFAKETQTAIHSLIRYQKPMGWDNQLVTQPLVNLEVEVSKTMYSYRNMFDVQVGGRAAVGSLVDMGGFQATLRFGLLPRGFGGYFDPNNRRPGKLNHFYVFLRPRQSVLVYNAMLEGKNQAQQKQVVKFSGLETEDPSLHPEMNPLLSEVELGLAFGSGRFSMGYTQLYSSPYSKVSYDHSVGTVFVAFKL